MHVSCLLIIPILAVAEAKLNRFHEGPDISPKDAGAYHTEVFETLGEMFKNNEPENEIDIIVDLSNVMLSYCPEGDATYNPHRVTLERFNAAPVDEITYPEEFDENFQKAIENTLRTVESLNEQNIDEVVDQLAGIQNELEKMEGSSIEAYQTLSLAGVSVAIESSKLWHSVVYDRNHNLHKLVVGGRRKLQFWSLPSIIVADVNGLIEGALTELSGNATLFFNPVDLVSKSLLASISASAKAALLLISEKNRTGY